MRVTTAFSTIVAALSLTSSVHAARNKVSRSSNGVGCTAEIATSSAGFNARFYDYPLANLLKFNDDSWVANEYTTAAVIATATGVVDPNFSTDAVILNHATLTNYNLTDVNINSAALELKGYFVGMYQISSLTFFLR